ncbi:Carboxylesterase 5A [Chionoecetes opilio]|uniref:Carboxylesterase 5A n=1 Tax=Chionoecetes opilio TaxID=41210 RepID=A0A8J8WAY6_CHIOP|nr:Carboxylesterase 5A [Chionoecetes opilio]
MEAALSISKALNCTGEDSLQLLACFMEASVEALVTVQNALSVWFNLPLTFGAQIDGTFFPDSPAALLKTGRYNKVDLMIGWTKDDGNLITTGLFSKAGEALLRYLNENFDKVWPRVFMMEENNPIYLARRMIFNYMSDFNVTIEDEIAFTTLIRDQAYEIPGVQSAELHAKNTHTKTFMYRLDHCLEKSRFSILTNTYIQRKSKYVFDISRD